LTANAPAATVERLVTAAATTILERRADWDRLDALSGDGDFGTTMAAGAEAVLARVREGDLTGAALLAEIAALTEQTMGGTSGPLWSAALRAAASAARDELHAATLLSATVDAIQQHGRADVGDKTMLDALVPARDALDGAADDARELARLAAEAAVAGAARTRSLTAKRGRAAYSGARGLGAPDPGAVAVATILATVSKSLGGPAFEKEVEDLLDQPPSDTEAGVGARAARTKHFINDPQDAALEALAGLARAHPDLVIWDEQQRIVHRRHIAPGKVGIVSGGGSGHEPLHAGYVGPGMLTAAAPGPVFASPTAEQILAATRSADAGTGVLHVVKNYTGDVINFEIARARATELGIETTAVLIADDVGSAEATEVGRRGTGATLLVEKIAGARAESGATLDAVTEIAERTSRRSVSFGVTLTPCARPGAGPMFQLGEDEIELGIGIHGERGARRSEVVAAAHLTAEVAELLLADLQPEVSSSLLVFVNGLGATPLLELYLLYGNLVDALARLGHQAGRSLVGSYVTSLDMRGVSFTLLELDDELAALWDAPVLTPALRWGQ
jgi:dihydroxyacetone kinase